jgi:hypothetical protein
MPLGKEYDKMIDSKFADMKNTGGRHAGSITAAQFLKRFVNDTPWAHLDIAGTAMGSPLDEINQSWGSGYGVRLLDELVRANYEPPLGTYERVVFMFDGYDQEQLEGARAQWKKLKGEGHSLTYWQQTSEGRWEKKA